MPVNEKKKILFLAWGFSIHAFRRISIFTEDTGYDVCVVSTHNYNFTYTKNIRLIKAIIKDILHSKRKEKTYDKSSPAPGIDLNKKSKTIEEIRKIIKNKIFILLLLPFDIIIGLIDYLILSKAVKTFKPDLIFLQTFMYPNYLSLLLPKKITTLITFWNGDVIWWKKKNAIDVIFKQSIVRAGIKRVNSITVNSQMAYNACVDLGSDETKINIIRYPGIDTEIFKPKPKEKAKKELNIFVEHVVIWPRGIGGYLNDDVFMNAIIEVIELYPDTLVLMLGPNTENGYIYYKELLAKNNIQDNFKWIGTINWEEIPNYYASADVMVSISSNDSLPNCMLEAMAMKIPVIMGNIPQIREWIIDGQNGFLVPTNDAKTLSQRIIQTFNNDQLMQQFVYINNKRIIEEVNKKKNIARIKDLVKQRIQH